MTRPPPNGIETGLVTIVLPAKNEEAAIGQTLRCLPEATLRAMGFDVEVVVLDGHSRDATPEIARRHRAIVVPDCEPGKGSALRNARELFRGQYVIMMDADGTYAPDAIPRVLTPLARSEADVVMGIRTPINGAMTGSHRVGNAMLSLLASAITGRACRDLCTGLWGFRIAALRSLPLRSRGFGLEAELFAVASRLQMRIGSIPVDYLPRNGRTKLSFARDGLRIARRLMRASFLPLQQTLEVERTGAGLSAAAVSDEVGA